MRFATPQGFNSGDQFFAYLKDAFDLLYEEGDPKGLNAPKMMSIGLHCRIVGHPGRAGSARALPRLCARPPGRVGHAARRHRAPLANQVSVRRARIVTLADINAMDEHAFVRTLGGIFEHSPWVAQRAFADRPFASVDALHAAMVAAVDRAGEPQQLALLRAHPELAGKAAIRGEMTRDSVSEQSGAGLSSCSPEEFAQAHRPQRALQRALRLSVHPGRERLRPRRHPPRVRAAREQRPRDGVRRVPRADRAHHAVPVAGAARLTPVCES